MNGPVQSIAYNASIHVLSLSASLTKQMASASVAAHADKMKKSSADRHTNTLCLSTFIMIPISIGAVLVLFDALLQ